MNISASVGMIRREEIIGDCRLILGDCLDVLPTLGPVDAVVTDVASSDAVVYTDKYGQTASRQPEAPARGGGSLGSETPGNRAALHGRNVVASADCGAIRRFTAGDGEGSSSHGDCVEVSLSVGAAEWPVQGRVGEHRLSADDNEGRLRALRGDGKPLHSPQGRGPHEQRPVELGGHVHEMPQLDAQSRVVALPQGWAIVTDPPYGIGIDGQRRRIKGKKSDRKGYEFKGWDTVRPEAALKLIAAIDCPKIVWGGNYFADLFPQGERWLSWDKGQRIHQSDCELAYTNLTGALRVFTLNRVALMSDGAVHPTQKPIALMQWCLGFLPKSKVILDPFMGSGTTGVACAKMGRSFIGIEIDEGYFETACKRIRDTYAQPDMFVERPAPAVQEGLF